MLLSILVGIIVVGAFYYMISHQSDGKTEDVETTELDQVLNKDINTVMTTPREVVNFYSSIVKCYYNEELTEEDIKAVGTQARALFDEELLENNPEDVFFSDLTEEILEYNEAKRIIFNYNVESGEKVEYYTEEEREYALVNASYTLKESSNFTKANEEYMVRKDEEGNWKILGWKLADKEVSEESSENEQ